jgi:hypothetical protein
MMVRQEGTTKEKRDSGLEQSVRSLQDFGSETAKDAGRFIQAAVEANTEWAIGSIEVVSDLLVNLAEATVPRRSHKGDKPRDVARLYTDSLTNAARHINTAFADAAKVIQRSADKFSSVFDTEEDGTETASKKASDRAANEA